MNTASHNEYSYLEKYQCGLSEDVVRRISSDKQEPEWMLTHRLNSLKAFRSMSMPDWGPALDALDLDSICYYARVDESPAATSWDEVPEDIKNTFERLGIPEAERASLAGAGAQYESETVYHSLKQELVDAGVVFLDLDEALRTHPDMVREYFMQCVPSSDHKFAALHGAVWSGGTFLYVPAGVTLEQPIQSYFRMNAPGMGQFEHTMIIIEEGAQAHYIEGCSAPKYNTSSLHAGCVEVYVKAGAKFRYSSAENWSSNTYNLNTKRAWVDADARMEWVGANMGSGTTMLYPCSVLRGEGASADHFGVAFADSGQNQDTGAKVFHAAPQTSSTIVSKSISQGSGVATYRGDVRVASGATGCVTHTVCDALLLSDKAVANAYPSIDVACADAITSHEASVGQLNEDDVFYLMSRGLSEERARSLIVNGFLDSIVRELPLEYAVEINRLIEMSMEE